MLGGGGGKGKGGERESSNGQMATYPNKYLNPIATSFASAHTFAKVLQDL